MNTQRKIVRLPGFLRTVRRLRAQGSKMTFTNGCFDILHFGHVRYLETAKKPGRILIVGLNSDASVRRLKGPSRPVNPQGNRAAVLAALACVDYVIVFDELTPMELISKIQPDILVKGEDWKGKEVVGSDIVKARGGRVELITYEAGCSTTAMIGKIQKS